MNFHSKSTSKFSLNELINKYIRGKLDFIIRIKFNVFAKISLFHIHLSSVTFIVLVIVNISSILIFYHSRYLWKKYFFFSISLITLSFIFLFVFFLGLFDDAIYKFEILFSHSVITSSDKHSKGHEWCTIVPTLFSIYSISNCIPWN